MLSLIIANPPQVVPMPKPFDPREQDVQTSESLIRALRDAQRERDAFTKATGVPDERGFMQIPEAQPLRVVPMRTGQAVVNRLDCDEAMDELVERFTVASAVRSLLGILHANEIDVEGKTLAEIAETLEEQ